MSAKSFCESQMSLGGTPVSPSDSLRDLIEMLDSEKLCLYHEF